METHLGALLKFQSTHSQGVRPCCTWSSVNGNGISIHALTRSATLLYDRVPITVPISIHALTRSATFCHQ